MSKSDPDEESFDIEQTIEYVYVPSENVYGTIVRYGAWSSLVEYYDGGIKYIIELPNDEIIEVDEIGIGYLEEETEEDL